MLLRREKELACLVYIFVQTEMESFVKMFEKFIDTMTDLLSNYSEVHKQKKSPNRTEFHF